MHFTVQNIFIIFVLLLVSPLFVPAPAVIAAETTAILLTPQEFEALSPIEQQNYIESVQGDPSKYSPPANLLGTSSPTQTTTELIADVRLQDCSYTQATSTDQTIRVSCAITNKLKTQGDIRVGVQLLKISSTNPPEVVDTKVYDHVLSLRKDQTVQQYIEYTAPGYLSGQYELWGFLRTSSGLPLSSNRLATITLKATVTPYLEIKSKTCTFRIQDNAATTTYALTSPHSAFTIDPSDTLEGTCAVTAHAVENTTVTLSLITYRESIFGDVVSTANTVQKAFAFTNNETKTISFTVPKVSAPQTYVVILSLKSPQGQAVSNEVVIQYAVRGASATIQNVLLDKDYYVSGDTAHVSVFWTGSIPFMERGDSPPDTGAKHIAISLKDNSNISCASETTFAISTDTIKRGPLATYPLRITRLCIDPQVIIEIRSTTGALLGNKTVALTSSQIPRRVMQMHFSRQRTTWYGVAVLVALIAAGVILYMRKRSNII